MTPLPLPTRTYAIEGMSCAHCKAAVETAVEQLEGVSRATVDLAAGVVSVEGEAIDDGAVRSAVDEAGYEVTA